MTSLKEYLQKRLAERPALAPRREPVERLSCARCDGEVFFLSASGQATCAGCGAPVREKSGSDPD